MLMHFLYKSDAFHEINTTNYWHKFKMIIHFVYNNNAVYNNFKDMILHFDIFYAFT